MIQIFIIDDQTLIRDGLQVMLNSANNLGVVGTGGSAEEGLGRTYLWEVKLFS